MWQLKYSKKIHNNYYSTFVPLKSKILSLFFLIYIYIFTTTTVNLNSIGFIKHNMFNRIYTNNLKIHNIILAERLQIKCAKKAQLKSFFFGFFF